MYSFIFKKKFRHYFAIILLFLLKCFSTINCYKWIFFFFRYNLSNLFSSILILFSVLIIYNSKLVYTKIFQIFQYPRNIDWILSKFSEEGYTIWKPFLKKTKIQDREIFLHFKIIDNFSSRLTCALYYISIAKHVLRQLLKKRRVFSISFFFFFFFHD